MGIPEEVDHINVGGPKAAGKTEVLYELIKGLTAAGYEVGWVSVLVTRAMRIGEINGQENLFVPDEEFWRRMDPTADVIIGHQAEDLNGGDARLQELGATRMGNVIFRKSFHPPIKKKRGGGVWEVMLPDSVKKIDVKGKPCFRGIPDHDYWPPIEPGKILISNFGKSTPAVDKRPGMLNVFVAVSSMEELERRLQERNLPQRLSFWDQWQNNLDYLATNPEKDFDVTVYNDGTPWECAKQIAKIAGLRWPPDPR